MGMLCAHTLHKPGGVDKLHSYAGNGRSTPGTLPAERWSDD